MSEEEQAFVSYLLQTQAQVKNRLWVLPELSKHVQNGLGERIHCKKAGWLVRQISIWGWWHRKVADVFVYYAVLEAPKYIQFSKPSALVKQGIGTMSKGVPCIRKGRGCFPRTFDKPQHGLKAACSHTRCLHQQEANSAGLWVFSPCFSLSLHICRV